jgi:hypothetical protein
MANLPPTKLAHALTERPKATVLIESVGKWLSRSRRRHLLEIVNPNLLREVKDFSKFAPIIDPLGI